MSTARMYQPTASKIARAYAGLLRGGGIKDIHSALLKRETSVLKLCNESLRIIDQTENLNAYITICKDNALKKACQLDEGLTKGKGGFSNNSLYGVPISIKDNFCIDQMLTTCGSKMLCNFVPPYTATAVSKLMEANCIITGKTNMDEFAMGSSSLTSFYGPTANCWKNELPSESKPSENKPNQWYMAGGSSTGSAISVASGACFASLGTDTGGSTRQPASLTGTVGFKPTYGLISRFGLIPLAHCLDVVSILARRVDDVNLVFDTIVGQDENDLTTVDHRTELRSNFEFESSSNVTIRVGIPEEFISQGNMSEDVSEQFDKVLRFLSNNNNKVDGNINFELVKLNLPNSKLATECYTIISSAEIASNMSCYDGVKFGLSISYPLESNGFDRNQFFKSNRDEGFGSEVKKRILLGNYFLLSDNREKYLVQAMKLRRLISEEFSKAFIRDKVDVILMPSTPTTSVSYAEWIQKADDNKLFHQDYFLIPSNLANLPSISLPSGLSNKGLPVGLQLIANKFHDLDLLSISKLFESSILESVHN